MMISNRTQKKLSRRSIRKLKKILSSEGILKTSHIYSSIQFMILDRKLNIRIMNTDLTFDDASENFKQQIKSLTK